MEHMDRREFLRSGTVIGFLAATTGLSFATSVNAQTSVVGKGDDLPFKKVIKTNAEWKRILTPEQYRITRKAGTEKSYSSPLNDVKKSGTFSCVCCDLTLFSSKTKYDSHTGWPSFYKPINAVHVKEKVDKSFGMRRTEVLCNRCNAHLGHVFNDGPEPTGLRYCINGVAMKFKKAV